MQRNGWATAGMVFAVMSLFFGIAFIFQILAILFSIIGIVKSCDEERDGVGRVKAIFAIIIALVAFAVGIGQVKIMIEYGFFEYFMDAIQ